MISIWDIRKNADNLVAMLLVKIRGLPAHCIKMHVMASSAASFFLGFLQKI